MNCRQFNTVALDEILDLLGHHPSKENEKEAWYINPFSGEKTASFKLDRFKNKWYLFSEAVGGNNTDFIQKYFNYTLPEVLQWAEKQNFSFFHQQKLFKKPEPNYRIDKVSGLQNLNLQKYLKERGLSPYIYKYLKEVHFTIGNKNLYAIGFKNLSEGFELRNSFYKGSVLKKDISVIGIGNTLSTQMSKSKNIAVFEGFMDALSFIELHKSYSGNILVMNSIALLKKTIDYLKDYSEIDLYLDNDKAGIKCTSEIIKSYPEAMDHSKEYRELKDYNEFLFHQTKARKSVDLAGKSTLKR
ncbi:toprim domain-containing protein [Elizabethkingia anophelis]|uniref:DNA primase n=1 Tax=Elizabethkingia anophelis TaxID=1117645 RepID=A0A7Z7LZX4_9FLAO|nr:toprim domain-containing protein [Elizabethkingia anophelis]STF08900.1 DNA primase [Elizabethkingia anophelis]